MCQNDSVVNLRVSFSKLMMACVFVLIMIPSAYADSGFEEPISGVFDWINEVVSGNIEQSNLPDSTETNLQNTLDSGTEAGKKGTILWFAIHEFFVNAIFAGVSETDLPISKDVIVVFSMLLVAFFIFMLLKKLVHENTKIGIIIIVIIIAFAIAGLTIEF